MIDPVAWGIAAGALFAGCWVQTAAGFGMAVVAAPVIILVQPDWVPVMLTLTALVLSLFNTVNQWQQMQLAELLPAFLTRVPGTVVGAWLLVQMSVFWLQLLVSLSVLLAVFASLWSPKFEATPARLGWAGFASGIFGTTTSIGGPPMALIMQHGLPGTIRANLSIYFMFSCSISLYAYQRAGLLTPSLWLVSFSMLPCAVLGFFAGIRSRAYIDAGRFRMVLLLLCAFSAVVAILGVLLRVLARG